MRLSGGYMDHFVYVLSQWEATLRFNVVAHWLGAYTKWSLWMHGYLSSLSVGIAGRITWFVSQTTVIIINRPIDVLTEAVVSYEEISITYHTDTGTRSGYQFTSNIYKYISSNEKCHIWSEFQWNLFECTIDNTLLMVQSMVPNRRNLCTKYSHYNDVTMSAMASQITNLTIVYSAVYSGADQGKPQSSALLAFLRGIHRWPVNSSYKWPVTRKMFLSDDLIMLAIYCRARQNASHRTDNHLLWWYRLPSCLHLCKKGPLTSLIIIFGKHNKMHCHV